MAEGRNAGRGRAGWGGGGGLLEESAAADSGQRLLRHEHASFSTMSVNFPKGGAIEPRWDITAKPSFISTTLCRLTLAI